VEPHYKRAGKGEEHGKGSEGKRKGRGEGKESKRGKGGEVWVMLLLTFLEKSAPMVIVYSRYCRSCSFRIV
jgi:hypothetical protein